MKRKLHCPENYWSDNRCFSVVNIWSNFSKVTPVLAFETTLESGQSSWKTVLPSFLLRGGTRESVYCA